MKEREQKEFYLMVKGQKVIVSEEIYRAYVQPVRAEQQQRKREKRCILEKVVNGKKILFRCKGKCSICEKFLEGNKNINRLCSKYSDIVAHFPAPRNLIFSMLLRRLQQGNPCHQANKKAPSFRLWAFPRALTIFPDYYMRRMPPPENLISRENVSALKQKRTQQARCGCWPFSFRSHRIPDK